MPIPFDNIEIPFVYVVSAWPTLLPLSGIEGKKEYPILNKKKAAYLFPEEQHGLQRAARFASKFLPDVSTSPQVCLVYKCIDLKGKTRDWNAMQRDWNSDAWFTLEPQDFYIVELQPITKADRSNLDKVPLEFEHRHFSFVPEPKFKKPLNLEELKNNLIVYLFYRTGAQRGHITHLRSCGKFKGYSVKQKDDAATNLLNFICGLDNYKISNKNILTSGLLGNATAGYEKIIEPLLNISSEDEESRIGLALDWRS